MNCAAGSPGTSPADAAWLAVPATASLPSVPGMRTGTAASCVRYLAMLSNGLGTEQEPAAELLAEMREVLDRFILAGLPYDTGTDGRPRFDLVELRNFINVADLQFDDPFLREHAMPLGRRLMLEPFGLHGLARYTAEPNLGAAPALRPRRFRLSLSRTYGAAYFKRRQHCRLRLPVPLEGATLYELSLQLLTPAAAAVIRSSRTPGRFDVVIDPSTVSDLTVAANFEFVADPDRIVAQPLHERETALALAPSEGLIRITVAVRELADKLAGGETDALASVRTFWEYLHARLNIGALRYSQLDREDPLPSILRIGWADCQLTSALLVALCRARGIPARLVSGFILQPALPGFHYWSEVWIPGRGWLPFDPLGFSVTRPGQSPAWRDIYFGRIDYRARTECLPHLFTGLPGVQVPFCWHLNVERIEGGVRTRLEDSSCGEAVFSQEVRCQWLR
jgi:hypothetical protein